MADLLGDRETIKKARIRALHAYALLNAATGGSFMGEREALLLASDELLQALKLALAARGKKVELIEAEIERGPCSHCGLDRSVRVLVHRGEIDRHGRASRQCFDLGGIAIGPLVNERPSRVPTSLAALDEGRTWVPPAKAAQGSLLAAVPARDGNAHSFPRPATLAKAATAVPSWARCACGAQAQVNAAVCAKCAASAAASGAPLCGCGAPNGGDAGDLCEECADAVTEFDLPTAGELAAEGDVGASGPVS